MLKLRGERRGKVDELTLHTTKREVLGKKARFLRRQGITPVHLFGHSIESQALQCDTTQLKHIIAQAGLTKLIDLKIDHDRKSRSVFIKEIQSNSINRELLHVDFYQVRKGETIRIDVPIVLTGESPALKVKGRMITHGVTSLHVECLPENLPSQIEIDLSQLEEVEQSIHIRDITLDPSVTVHADPEQLVVKVSEVGLRREEEEEEAAALAAAAEVEAGAEVEGTPEERPSAES